MFFPHRSSIIPHFPVPISAFQISQPIIKGVNRACTNFTPFIWAEGAPLYEQRQLRSSDKCRRHVFANGARWSGHCQLRERPAQTSPSFPPQFRMYLPHRLRRQGKQGVIQLILSGEYGISHGSQPASAQIPHDITILFVIPGHAGNGNMKHILMSMKHKYL